MSTASYRRAEEGYWFTRELGAYLGLLAAAGLHATAAELGAFPEPVLGGRGELGEAGLEAAADLHGQLDLAGVPLRVNPYVELKSTVLRHLRGTRGFNDERGELELASAIAAESQRFEDALRTAHEQPGASRELLLMTGAQAGWQAGAQGIPSRLTTYLPGSEAGLHLEDLADEVRGLVGDGPASRPSPLATGEPVQVDPELPIFAADWLTAAATDPSWAVLSLCRTWDTMQRHPVRRQVYLVDQEHHAANPALGLALDDAVGTIDAWLLEDPGRPVVVHCHAGQSRTGFVLKAWAMQRYGFDEQAAHGWLAERWPRVSRHNQAFTDELLAREA